MRILWQKSKHKKALLIGLPVAAGLLWYTFCLPNPLFKDFYSNVLYARDGQLLGARIASDGQWRFPESTDQLPQKYVRALLTFEDKRFYHHMGVDPLAVGRALRQNLQRKEVVSGASTLTMQVIRLSCPAKRRTLARKVYEIILATRLELRCSKDRILHLYSAHAPFGGNVVGLEAACRRYFNRSPRQLSWAEASLLAVLPNAPSSLHPGRQRTALLQKRNRLLHRLWQQGDMDSLDYALALDEPLPQTPYAMPDRAYHLLDLAAKEHGAQAFITTIDPVLQEHVNHTVLRYNKRYRANKVENLAVLVADVHTGEILAYCGNVFDGNDPRPGGSVDVIQAPRSSGSTLKPFLYAAMLDKGLIWPDMLIKDTPFHTKNFAPRNFSNTFEGAVPARQVIEQSLNVPSVRMLDAYGTEAFLLQLKQLGFSTVTRPATDYGLSLILGGAEITLYDLVRAYYRQAAQLNRYTNPEDTCYKDLTYLLPQKESVPARERLGEGVFTEASLYLLMESLSQLNRPEEEASWDTFHSTRKIAWKTGTSWGHRDAWSVGITPQYVVGVWVGNATGEGRSQLTGVGYAAPVLFDVFAWLPASAQWFSLPEVQLEQAVVCAQSGHPASGLCPQTDTVWVPRNAHKPAPCPYHVLVHLDAERQYRVNSTCYPTGSMVHTPWFVLPPAQEWYYMQKHLNYEPLPPLHPALQEGAGVSKGLEIIYPQQGDVVITPLDLDGKTKGAVFRAAHQDREAILYWHIDDQYVGRTQGGTHQIKTDPAPGRHILYVTDQYGDGATVAFTVSDF